ncbi:MAG TPA: sulfate transporter subunit, partial [Vicinamibacteria bacterium]|nr:sulfate transporter subunit [Vicinamibacteria bacterium]
MRIHFLTRAVLATLLAAGGARAASVELLNVSYDPTRELWRDLN